jgi:uncharacterized protein YjeT (DUF2065 family)
VIYAIFGLFAVAGLTMLIAPGPWKRWQDRGGLFGPRPIKAKAFLLSEEGWRAYGIGLILMAAFLAYYWYST